MISILTRGLTIFLLLTSLANGQEKPKEHLVACLIKGTKDGRNFELAQNLSGHPKLTYTLRIYDAHFPKSGDKASCLEERIAAKRMFDIINSELIRCGQNYCIMTCRFDKWVPDMGGTIYGEIYLDEKRLTQALIERGVAKPINEVPFWCPTKIIEPDLFPSAGKKEFRLTKPLEDKIKQ